MAAIGIQPDCCWWITYRKLTQHPFSPLIILGLFNASSNGLNAWQAGEKHDKAAIPNAYFSLSPRLSL